MFAQSFDWAFSVGGGSTDGSTSIANDAQGNVVCVGWFVYTIDADPGPGIATLTGIGSGQSALVAKYDSLGNYLWAFRLGGIGYNTAACVATDDSSNIYVTGTISGTTDFDPGPGTVNLTATGSTRYIFVAKYDPNGNYQWAYLLGTSGGDSEGRGITADGAGNVFLTGSFCATVDFDPGAGTTNLTVNAPSYFTDAFVTSFTSAGQFRWAFRFGNSYNDWAYSVATDTSSNIYVTGKFRYTVDFDPGAGVNSRSASGVADGFVASYDSSGNFRWVIKLGGPGGDEGLYVSVANEDYVYVTGLFRDSSDFDPGSNAVTFHAVGGVNDADIFVGKYSAATGNYVWAFPIGSVNPEWSWCVKPDSSGNAYLTGYVSGIADFDPGPGVFNVTSSAGADIFLAKYDSSGYFISAFSIASPSGEIGYCVLPQSDKIYLSGSFNGSPDFDPGANTVTMTSSFGDLFVARYDQCTGADIPVVSASADTVCQNSSASLSMVSGNLNNSLDWYWYADDCGGLPIDSGINISVSPTVTTTYYCRGEKGCGGNGYCATVTVNVAICTATDSDHSAVLTVFPNPADDVLQFSLNFSASDVVIELFDILGERVLSTQYRHPTSAGQIFAVDISTLTSGTYLLLVRTETEVGSQVIIIND